MQALLAYKRPNAQGTVDFGFEVRPMTCFNGFNMDNAFRTVTRIQTRQLALVLPQGRTQDARYFQEDDNEQPWEFMALGWMSDVCKKNNYTGFLSQAHTFHSVEWCAQILNREHVTGMLFDHNSSRSVNGTRDRTPNELLLGNLLYLLGGTGEGQWAEGFQTSPVSWAFQARSAFHYSLYDFVGSERPSGLAVAYLQVYRNCSKHILNANHKVACSVSNFVGRLDNSMGGIHSRYKSFIPIISAMTNAGSDSDIFSFSNAPALTLQIMKFGTFSIGKFMGNPAPMTREGRYAKGAQSSSLERKVNEAVRRNRVEVPTLNIGRLGAMRTMMNTLDQYCDHSRVINYGLGTYLDGIQNYINNMRRELQDPSTIITEIQGAFDAYRDLCTPVVTAPAPRVAGASRSFRQWAEETASTVH